MRQQELLLDIVKYFSRFVVEVEMQNSNSEYSINIHSENVMLPILNVIFDLNLVNANLKEEKNSDTVDLVDRSKRMAFQITSTKTIEKIKKTLDGFINKEKYKDFDSIKIYILTKRQEKYNEKVIEKIINKKFSFDIGNDIIDCYYLYNLLNEKNDITKIEKVRNILQSQFGHSEQASELNKIESFSDLCRSILPILNENGLIFSSFGPNSSKDVTEKLRVDFTMWEQEKRKIIVPNNKAIREAIQNNMKYVPERHREIFGKLIAHTLAFETHCNNPDFDYSDNQFPKEIIGIVNESILDEKQ